MKMVYKVYEQEYSQQELVNCLSYLNSIKQQLEQCSIDQRQFLSIRVCREHIVMISKRLSYNNALFIQTEITGGETRLMDMRVHIDKDCVLCHLKM